jgi:hypothetical protein
VIDVRDPETGEAGTLAGCYIGVDVVLHARWTPILRHTEVQRHVVHRRLAGSDAGFAECAGVSSTTS